MSKGAPKKILIVDDDKDILDIISYVMTEMGY
jgi:DNA-binding response OmpR family regulator